MHAIRYADDEIIEKYNEEENCKAVAIAFGISDETVRRVLIRNGINRTHRHPKKPVTPIEQLKPTIEELKQIVDEYYGTNKTIYDLAKKYHRAQTTISDAIKEIGNGLKTCEKNAKKITDSELVACVENGLTCSQIAHRYSVSVERVFRRAKKIGIRIREDWRGGHWKRRADRYGCNEFDESITLEGVYDRFNGICQICGLHTDRTDIENGHVKRMYPTVDHIIPLSKGGTHTWGNVQLAHMMCNAGKCDKLNTR